MYERVLYTRYERVLYTRYERVLDTRYERVLYTRYERVRVTVGESGHCHLMGGSIATRHYLFCILIQSIHKYSHTYLNTHIRIFVYIIYTTSRSLFYI